MIPNIFRMRFRPSLVCTLMAMLATAPSSVGGQPRPSIESEFLLLLPNLTDQYVNTRWVHGAVAVSAPIVRGARMSWVATAQRAVRFAVGGEDPIYSRPAPGQPSEVRIVDLFPRGALLSGVAYHDQSLMLRLKGGVTRYNREWGGSRNAPQVRADLIFPPARKVSLTMSASYAWLGEQHNQTLNVKTFGLGMRLAP